MWKEGFQPRGNLSCTLVAMVHFRFLSVSTCNVSDLSPFDAGSDSRTNPFKEKVNDENRSAQSFKDLLVVLEGAITTA